jgi:hypothetical protein
LDETDNRSVFYLQVTDDNSLSHYANDCRTMPIQITEFTRKLATVRKGALVSSICGKSRVASVQGGRQLSGCKFV